MKRTLVLALSLVALVPSSARATTYTIAMKDAFFSPSWTTKSMGSGFRFDNQGDLTHNTKLAGGAISSWNKDLAPSQTWTKTLTIASKYSYYCRFHSGMTGAIGIPVRIAPTSGSTATAFTVRLALADAPAGYVYDAQRKKDGGAWAAWKTGVTNDTYTFKAGSLGTGTYYFRARLRHVSSGHVTGYSPGKGITVS